MKRIFVLILALCLMLSLAACAKEQPTPATTEAPKTEAPATTEAPKTEAPATTEAPKTEASETEAVTEAPATEPAEQAAIRGTQAGDTYTNEMLNLQINKPKGWVFYTDEQIAQVNNMTSEALKETNIADVIGKNGQFTDMMMADAAGNSVNLILQPKQSILDIYSDEQIFTLSEETMKAQFSAAGMTVNSFEPTTITFGEEEKTVLHMGLKVNDIEADEYQYWFRNDGEYMGILTVAIVDGSDPQTVLDAITPIN